jgi:hypothetical protein
MSDTLAIAAAIAARFSSGVTPPAGQPAIVEVTHLLPDGIAAVPSLYVFPPDEPDIEHLGSATRFSVQHYPVRLYIVQEPSLPNDLTSLHGWRSSVQDRILLQFQLGRAGEVAVARISSIRPGVLTYAGQDYLGLDMVVSVTVSEPIAPVA